MLLTVCMYLGYHLSHVTAQTQEFQLTSSTHTYDTAVRKQRNSFSQSVHMGSTHSTWHFPSEYREDIIHCMNTSAHNATLHDPALQDPEWHPRAQRISIQCTTYTSGVFTEATGSTQRACGKSSIQRNAHAASEILHVLFGARELPPTKWSRTNEILSANCSTKCSSSQSSQSVGSPWAKSNEIVPNKRDLWAKYNVNKRNL